MWASEVEMDSNRNNRIVNTVLFVINQLFPIRDEP